MEKLNKLVIYKSDLNYIIFNVDNNKLINFHFFYREPILYNIYRAKVLDFNKNLGIFFLDIGNNNYAILKKKYNIHLTIGQIIIVQIIKEGTKNKHPTASINICFLGFYCIYYPENSNSNNIEKKNKNIKFSNNINPLIKSLITPVIRDNISNNDIIIIRSTTNENNINNLLLELNIKKQIWHNLNHSVSSEIGIIYTPNFIFNLIYQKNLILPELILGNDNKFLINLSNIIREELPYFNIEIINSIPQSYLLKTFEILTDIPENIFNIDNNIEIIINQTEALTLIDINFKGNIGLSAKEDALLLVNIKSIPKILELIALKNISGQILVDVLKLKNKSNKDYLIQKYQEYINNTNLNIEVLGFTRLGILELVIKKYYISISDNFLDVCSCCNGYGKIANINYLFFKAKLNIDNLVKNNPITTINIKSSYNNLTNFQKLNQLYLEFLKEQKALSINFITDNNINYDIIVY